MIQDANDNQAQTEPTQTAPDSQPAQGSDTQAADTGAASVPAQQAQGVQQQQPMIPKWRLDEVLAENRQLKAERQQPQPQAQQPKPQGDGAPKETDFDNYTDYVRALGRYEARQEYNRAKQEDQQQAQAKSFEDRVKNGAKTYTEKVYEAAAKNPAILSKLENAPSLRPDLNLFGLHESDTPVALAEHLADNPMLIHQLNQMPMEKALKEMGKIEAKLSGSSGQPPRKPSAGIPALDAVGAGNKPGPRSGDNLSQEDVIARLYGPKN